MKRVYDQLIVKTFRLICINLITALALSPAAFAQELSTRIFVLNARPAAATVDMIRPLLSPNGKVFPDTRLNKLVVRDTPEVLAEVEDLLEQVDVHAPQVRIHVNMNGVSNQSATNGGIAISGVAGNRNRNNVSVSGSVYSRNTQSQSQSQQNLLVMSGEKGFIHIAEDVVNTNPFQQFAVQQGLLPPTFVFQQVGTGFAVEPIVVGDVVRVKVTPWMSFIGPNGGNEIQVTEASSTFAVKSGQTVTVASGGYNQKLKNRAFGLILGGGSQSNQRNSSISLTPVVSDY